MSDPAESPTPGSQRFAGRLTPLSGAAARALGTPRLRRVASIALGAAVGYLLFRLVGCRSGTCLITSRWWSAVGSGAGMGYLLTRGQG